MSDKVSSPATGYVNINPSDTAVFSPPLRGIYVGVGGNIILVGPDGSVGIFINVPQGKDIPGEVSQVLASNTTATNLVGYR